MAVSCTKQQTCIIPLPHTTNLQHKNLKPLMQEYGKFSASAMKGWLLLQYFQKLTTVAGVSTFSFMWERVKPASPFDLHFEIINCFRYNPSEMMTFLNGLSL